MKPAIIALMLIAGTVSAQEKFGDTKLKEEKAPKEMTSAKFYRTADSLALTVLELKVMPMPIKQGERIVQSGEVMVFEAGNPFSNKAAVIVENLTARHLDVLLAFKNALARGQNLGDGKYVELTQEEAENLILSVSKWLSDKKLNKK